MQRSRGSAFLVSFILAAALAGCSDGAGSSGPEPTSPRPTVTASTAPTPTASSTPSPTRTRHPRPADPRWVFFTRDRTRHGSPWFPGRHRVMIDFGCTEAPYYAPDASCPDGQGFHHGVDVAIPCGTPLLAGRSATVLPHDELGSAYGETPVLLRVRGMDVVVGHTREVYVDPGDRVARGQRFARVSDAGAPDGCHLHFEVRRAGGGVSDAVDPADLLQLDSAG